MKKAASIIAKTLVVSLFIFVFSKTSLACTNFGNAGDGCANYVLGVLYMNGVVELELSVVSWYPGHVCTGINRIQFTADKELRDKAWTVGLTSYVSGKGPVFFRCDSAVGNRTWCNCQVIVYGNTYRD